MYDLLVWVSSLLPPGAYWGIGLLGLFISVLASVLLFMGSPRDSTGLEQPVLPFEAQFYWETAEKAKKKRYRLSKVGFGLLLVGSVLQFFALFGQYPH